MDSDVQQLLSALQNPQFYNHTVSKIELIETHISWVILTGPYAYKIKKSVDLGFLNFSTLAFRKHYCELELSLNKRLAPDYYLEVIPITGSYDNPMLNGSGEAIEYALKMAQFPQDAELDRELASGKLKENSMDLLAEKIADFHQKINVANKSQTFGDLDHVHQPVLNCYSDILKRISENEIIKRIKALRSWSCDEFEKLKTVFLSRKENGFIRECHGDLHLRNIAIVDDEVIAFDCIEFNEDLRWNDVISECAFLIMDLDAHQKSDLASRFLNRYLELTGDYLGLKVLRYYLVYRAIVRAMVSCIRFSQEDIDESESASEYAEFVKYIDLAQRYIDSQQSKLFITHGLSGSGKTTVSQILLQIYPAIRVRSDIERKRLWGMKEQQRDKQDFQQGIYSSTSSEQTYQILLTLAEQLLLAGFSVIVDATFLKSQQRNIFRKLAESVNVDYKILHCYAPLNVMQNRIIQRSKDDRDASDADLTVLEYQIERDENFTEKEKRFVVDINTEVKIKGNDLIKKLGKIS